MRSSTGTNCGLAGLVVACTNSTMACLAGPGFHEGSGSVVWDKPVNGMDNAKTAEPNTPAMNPRETCPVLMETSQSPIRDAWCDHGLQSTGVRLLRAALREVRCC